MITIPLNNLSIQNQNDYQFIPLTYIHKKLLLPTLNNTQSKLNFTTPFTNNNLSTPKSTTQENTLANQLNNPLTTISSPSFNHPPTNHNVNDFPVIDWTTIASTSKLPQPLSDHATALLESDLINDATFGDSLAHSYSIEMLIDNLSLVALGTESPLFSWNVQSDRFEWRPLGDEKGKGRERHGRIWGMTSESSGVIIAPFLAIGTALVRLESVVRSLSGATQKATTTSNALASSLSTLLSWIRQEIASIQSSSPALSMESPTLASLESTSCLLNPLYVNLLALLDLFQCPLRTSLPYSEIPHSTPHLLSHLYNSLEFHLQNSTSPPLLIQASIAWLLDKPLRDLINGWSKWIGISEYEDERAMEREYRACGIDREFKLNVELLPSFFPFSVAEQLFEAGNCLAILRKAKHDHPLCRSRLSRRNDCKNDDLGLLWSDDAMAQLQRSTTSKINRIKQEISNWRSNSPVTSTVNIETPSSSNHQPHAATRDLYPPNSIFSQFPGSTIKSIAPTQAALLSDFFSTIYSSASVDVTRRTILPSSSPSLSILLSQSIFEPLIAFAPLASSSLLTLFLKDLSLPSYLSLLQDYFCLASPGFTERLRTALFAVDERERSGMVRGNAEGSRGAAEMSLGLRNALSDSIAEDCARVRDSVLVRTKMEAKVGEGDDEERRECVELDERVAWREANARLAFVVSDPIEGEEKRFSDSQSPGTLDYLHISYTPPTPLNLLITPRILQRYNQIFSHLLRFLRLQSSLYNLHLNISKPNLFAESLSSLEELSSQGRIYLFDLIPNGGRIKRDLHALAFEMRTVVGSLMEYSLAVGIAEKWQIFSRELESIMKRAEKKETIHFRENDGITLSLDQVMLLHERYLDEVLEALLLNQDQAHLLKIVYKLFDLVLALSKKTSEWKSLEARGGQSWNVENVVTDMETMKKEFHDSIRALVKRLQESKLDEDIIATPSEPAPSHHIAELLLRLDMNHWYTD